MIGRVVRPDSLQALWAALDAGALPMAGGTDLLVRRRGLPPCDVALLDALPGFAAVDVTCGQARIGAGATHAALAASPRLGRTLPVLAKALSQLGSPLIRNMGTLGGNIATASPAGDTLPPLLALDAVVELASRRGTRQMPLAAFLLGPGRTALEPGEIIAAVLVPLPAAGALHHFEKVGRRDALAIAVASLAAVIERDGDGFVTRARLAVGSLAPTAMRCPEAEDWMVGRRLDRETLAGVGRRIRDAVSPIDDIRATAAYRLRLAANLPLRLSATLPPLTP